MTDIALIWDNDTGSADIAFSGPDIATDDGMLTTIILSLFTDRQAAEGDDIPDGSDDRRGWWGDAFPDVQGDLVGSRLWLLDRAKNTDETRRLLKDYAAEALNWMIADGVAKSIEITVIRLDTTSAGMLVIVNRPDGRTTKFDYIWKEAA